MTQDISREKATLTVQNIDYGEFYIFFTNPADQSEIQSEPLWSGCSAAELKAGIQEAYQTLVGVNPTVTLGYYDNIDVEQADSSAITAYDCSTETCILCKDDAGAETDCTEYLASYCVTTEEVVCDDPLDTDCVAVSEVMNICPSYSYNPIWKYDIEVPKSISSYSWTLAEPVPTTTGSTINLYSAETQGFPSNPPLEGSYVVMCYNTDDLTTPVITSALNYNTDEWSLKFYIELACPTLRNKFQVLNPYSPWYYKEDGLNFNLWFKDVHVDLPQFEIIVNDLNYDGSG